MTDAFIVQTVLSSKEPNKMAGNDGRNRRDDLIQQLVQNTYECIICFEKVQELESIWSCGQCHIIFHLSCIQCWGKTCLQWQTELNELVQEPISPEMVTWRCPGCQLTNHGLPEDGRCFCGTLKNPEHPRIPHSCGQICHRPKQAAPAISLVQSCGHSCVLPCHPGPCPPCQIQVMRTCGCGKTQSSTICCNSSNADFPVNCSRYCCKLKICGMHRCTEVCHSGDCGPCDVSLTLQCNCGKESEAMECSAAARITNEGISCWRRCEKTSDGGHFSCQKFCHSDPCGFAKAEPEFSWVKRILISILILVSVVIIIRVLYIHIVR